MIDWSSSSYSSQVGRETIDWWTISKTVFVSHLLMNGQTTHIAQNWLKSDPIQTIHDFCIILLWNGEQIWKNWLLFYSIGIWNGLKAQPNQKKQMIITIIMDLNAWMMIVFIWIDIKYLNDFSFLIKLNRSRIRTITDNIFYVIIKPIFSFRCPFGSKVFNGFCLRMLVKTDHHAPFIIINRKRKKMCQIHEWKCFFYVWSFV